MADDDMPVNDKGVRADIVIGGEAVFNRMNTGQFYEQFINCVAHDILQRMKELTSAQEQYALLMEFLTDMNEEYARTIRQTLIDPKKQERFVRETIKKDLIVIVMPPFLRHVNAEWALAIRDKYDIHPTPVEYNLRDADGNLLRRVRTHKPVWIGKKYVYILCKIPHARSCGMSYINQLRVPIRIKTKKHKSQYPIGLVPIRLGEDENRNLRMAIGPLAYRIISLYANSPDATQKLTEDLLTLPKPTQLGWVNMYEEDIATSNTMTKAYRHMLATCGIDSENVLLTEDDEKGLMQRLRESGAPMERKTSKLRVKLKTRNV